jgi:hypothetical protein
MERRVFERHIRRDLYHGFRDVERSTKRETQQMSSNIMLVIDELGRLNDKLNRLFEESRELEKSLPKV